jgi:hypothetical protein
MTVFPIVLMMTRVSRIVVSILGMLALWAAIAVLLWRTEQRIRLRRRTDTKVSDQCDRCVCGATRASHYNGVNCPVGSESWSRTRIFIPKF